MVCATAEDLMTLSAWWARGFRRQRALRLYRHCCPSCVQRHIGALEFFPAYIPETLWL